MRGRLAEGYPLRTRVREAALASASSPTFYRWQALGSNDGRQSIRHEYGSVITRYCMPRVADLALGWRHWSLAEKRSLHDRPVSEFGPPRLTL
jgi:hypothetical protein